MNPSKIGVNCFVLLLLASPLAHGQEGKPKRGVDLLKESEQGLRSSDPEKRLEAIAAIARTADQLAHLTSALIHYGLKDPDDEIRIISAQALGNIGFLAHQATDPLEALLYEDNNPKVRIAAATALGGIFSQASVDRFHRKPVLALVYVIERDTDKAVRHAACRSLGNIGPGANDAAPLLLTLLQDKTDSHMQGLARLSFMQVVSPRCSQLLPELLAMHKKGIQGSQTEVIVLQALGTLGANDEAVLPLLLETFTSAKSKDIQVRTAAAIGIGAMGPKAKRAVPALLAEVESNWQSKRDERNHQLWVFAMVALGEIGPDAKQALPTIRRIAAHPGIGAEIRRKANLALTKLEGKPEE